MAINGIRHIIIYYFLWNIIIEIYEDDAIILFGLVLQEIYILILWERKSLSVRRQKKRCNVYVLQILLTICVIQCYHSLLVGGDSLINHLGWSAHLFW